MNINYMTNADLPRHNGKMNLVGQGLSPASKSKKILDSFNKNKKI